MTSVSLQIARRGAAGAAAVALLFTVTVVLGQTNTASEIEAVSEQYRQAWQRGDLDAVMRFWTPDAKSIGPGSSGGVAEIRASLEGSKKMGIHDLRHEDREIYGSGDTVVEVTRSVLFDVSGKPMFTMRYMTLWRKSEGRWRIHREFAIPVSVN